MALITENKDALAGGVSQQAAEHRLSNQVEEMVNCLPTLDKGLLKRNPTKANPLKYMDGTDVAMAIEENMWTFEHDRGAAADGLKEFSFSITSNGLQIVDIHQGILYDNLNGIEYESVAAQNYIEQRYGYSVGYSATSVKDSTFLVNKLVSPLMTTGSAATKYRSKGYAWIKLVDVVGAGYSYGCVIVLTDNVTGARTTVDVTTGAVANTSVEAARLLALAISNHPDTTVSATSSGSVVEINSTYGTNEVYSVSTYDTFGDTASFGWAHKVDYDTQLPYNMGDYNPVVEVGKNEKSTYWLVYTEGSWVESKQPDIDTVVNANTMPHIIVRRQMENTEGIGFYVKAYEWDDRLIGDDNTNKIPTFLEQSHVIKDVFFFRNRLGFITRDSVVVSEVGEYGNFWRTSVAASLDSDRIDAGIESVKAIQLEHVLVFDDVVMLFSDKAQFKFRGGDVLSPNSYFIDESTTYEMNIKVRPISVNNTIFFIAPRGNYSMVMEMELSNSSTRSDLAIDITAHCQEYITNNIGRLTASHANNMLFLTSLENTEEVYVYKWYDSGRERRQSAWFMWTFSGTIYSAFALGEKFDVLISRDVESIANVWIMGFGAWRMGLTWIMDYPWIMDFSTLLDFRQIESMDISPQPYRDEFIDIDLALYESFVNFGEWVAGKDGNKEIRGTLLFKTIQFASAKDSDFDLFIKDTNRHTQRTVKSKFLEKRKPMVYGRSKNMRTGIISESAKGFKISSVSFEGDLNRRATAR